METFDSKIQHAIDEAITILSRNFIKFIKKNPTELTNGEGIYEYQDDNYIYWDRGFWAGIYWLVYEITQTKSYGLYAQKKTNEFIGILKNKNILHTDLGFLSLPSCLASYKLMGAESSKEGIIYAADFLLGFYRDKARLVTNEDVDGGIIVTKVSDIMNVQLLNVAYRMTLITKYREVANETKQRIMKYNIAKSGEVYFCSYYDIKTKEMLLEDQLTESQRKRFLSGRMRGQAWAIYAFALEYAITKSPEVFGYYMRITEYFLSKLDEKYRDYQGVLGSQTDVPDCLALAISICGIFEMKKNSDSQAVEKHFEAAKNILELLIDVYSVSADSFCEGILKSSTHALKDKNNIEDFKNISCIQGDYFYLEALVRMMKQWDTYWY